MPVYVDDMEAPFGRMVMCHMIADTTDELLSMADRIGVQRKWVQHPGTSREHFDIALSKRRLAVKFGATEIDMRDLAMMVKRRQITGSLGLPSEAETWFEQWRKERKAMRGEKQ